jgi:hypothetical protein
LPYFLLLGEPARIVNAGTSTDGKPDGVVPTTGIPKPVIYIYIHLFPLYLSKFDTLKAFI